MITKGKKIKVANKGKKKISIPAKGRSNVKEKDEVCLIDDVLISERLYCCDDECCCLI
jgi:hypothetical protein